MVRISDIVGTLLRGITLARIQSDIFSSQASQQYLQTESLKSYPVPRAEIRQADVNMKLAVLETAPRDVDETAIAQQTLTESLPAYVDRLLLIPVKPGANAPDSQLQPLGTYLGTQAGVIKEQLREALESHLVQNIATVYERLMGSPQKFGGSDWRDRSIAVLQSVLASRQVSVYLSGSVFTKAVQNESVAWASGMRSDISLAIDTAKTAFFDLDLAVKKDQLLMLPEHVMSELRLSVVIENYEWTTFKDKQGNTINKLTHK